MENNIIVFWLKKKTLGGDCHNHPLPEDTPVLIQMINKLLDLNKKKMSNIFTQSKGFDKNKNYTLTV